MRSSRKANIALLVFACVLALAVFAWINRPRDEPAKATVDEAVRSFREDGGAAGEGDRAGGPPFGVYRYATRGSESAQTPLAGATHDYGGISTIVISEGPCGLRERWQVLEGRWSEGEACTNSGEETLRITEYHEFFGIGQEDTFRCHGEPISDSLARRPGAHFSSTCESDDSSISNSSRIVGLERIPVGAEDYKAVHVETRSLIEGENSGIARSEEWRRRSDGLLLRRTVESDADASTGGGTHYSEECTIRLLEATPRR
ncbi:MAG: hypothetical protein WA687_09320 [Solirubrobacterales bacterium]